MSDVPTMFKERSQSDRPFFFRSAAFFSYEVMIELGSRVYHTRLPAPNSNSFVAAFLLLATFSPVLSIPVRTQRTPSIL